MVSNLNSLKATLKETYFYLKLPKKYQLNHELNLIVAILHHQTTTLFINVKRHVAFLHQFSTSCNFYIKLTNFFPKVFRLIPNKSAHFA